MIDDPKRHTVRRVARLLGVLAFGLFVGVLPAATTRDEARIKTEVENRYNEWLSAASRKDGEAITNLYDEDAVLMPKSEESVVGKAAIREYYRKLFTNPQYVSFTASFASDSFHAAGDIAIDAVTFAGDLTRDGKPIHFRGKALVVWKKETDGSWKVLRYMFDEIPAKK